MYGSATFARHVRSRPGGGLLVNITSGAATTPYEGWAAYCAAKAAVDQLTRVVAAEEAGGPAGRAVAPGVVDTDMQEADPLGGRGGLPRVERFRDLARDGAFNSPAWVADHILRLLDEDPGTVVLRIPDEPRA